MKKLKIVFIIGAIVSVLIWVVGTYNDLNTEKQELIDNVYELEFANAKAKAEIDSIKGIGNYIVDQVIDTVITEKVTLDSITIIDTVLVIKEALVIEIDTVTTFEWAEDWMKVRVRGKLYAEEKRRDSNYLTIIPEEWVSCKPKCRTIKIKPLPNYGFGFLGHNSYAGLYTRYRNFKFGVTKDLTTWKLGIFFGYEIVSF